MALPFKVSYTPFASDCMTGIRDYIKLISGDIDIVNKVFKKIANYIDDTLPYSPYIGRIPDNESLQRKNIRRITALDRYNIFYRVDEQSQMVYILKIADGRQSTDHQLFGL